MLNREKKIWKICLFLLALSLNAILGGWIISDVKKNYVDNQESKRIKELEKISIDNFSEQVMYEKYISALLDEKLYKSRDAYDACHYLMVPMYYAFQSKNETYVKMYMDYMQTFADFSWREKKEFDSMPEIDRNQHLYFVSEYMCLCAEYGYDIPEKLYKFVYDEMNRWIESYTGCWASIETYHNMWEVFDGLLTGVGYGAGKSYDNVFTDYDLFTLAILCDLKFVLEEKGMKAYDISNLKKAEKYANQMMESEVTWNEDGTWLFQVGVWRDYKDYIYAGLENPEDIQEGKEYKVETIASDSNHFMRMCLFLRSFRRAQSQEEYCQYYVKLLEGLGKTFCNNVLVFPDGEIEYYRLKNYMDGTNGLFRYGYHEDEIGYGPYQQSSEFLLGWWAFCGNEEITRAYAYTAERFPLNSEGKVIYTDPVTVREQNKIFLMENYEQFLCYLAGKLVFP